MQQVIVLALAIITLALPNRSNANDLWIEAFGNSFEMDLIQKNGQNNDLQLYVYGDYHLMDIIQDGNNNLADITVDGLYPTNLTLYQNSNNQSFQLNYYCNNPGFDGYCYINVVQY